MSSHTSLVHYTTLDSFYGITQDLKEKPNLNFHASNILMMNDMEELNFFMSKFFTESKSKTILKNELNKLIAENGDLYVLSFMKSDKMIYGKLPMWKMYADNGKGIRLKFSSELFKDTSICEIKKCEYKTKKEIQKLVSAKNAEIKYINEKQSYLMKLQEDIAIYKYEYWRYEDEYRLIKRSNAPKFKTNSLGIISYIDIKIPLKYLSEILIGPMANQMIVEKTLKQLKDVLLDKYGNDNVKFKINKSKLKLYVL